MFGSDILDIAIGLVLVYLLMSLIMTAVQETVTAILKQRGANLRSALLQLMQGDTALLDAFYQHPLVAALYEGELRQPGWLRRGANYPSYIPREICAAAVRDLSQQQFAGTSALKGILDSVQTVAGLDVQAQQRQLEIWYDAAMDRASGWYKRHTQKVLFVIGLLTALLMNVNSVTIAQYLALNPQQRELVVALAQKASAESPAEGRRRSADTAGADTGTAGEGADGNQAAAAPAGASEPTGNEATAAPTPTPAAVARPPASAADEPEEGTAEASTRGPIPINEYQLKDFTDELQEIGLPIGWTTPSLNWVRRLFPTRSLDWSWNPGDFSLSVALAWMLLIAGYFITAFAVMLGAPFWFDVLNKFMVIRGTVKPREKSPDESSEDRQTSARRHAAGAPAMPPAAPPDAANPHGPAPDRGDNDSPVFG